MGSFSICGAALRLTPKLHGRRDLPGSPFAGRYGPSRLRPGSEWTAFEEERLEALEAVLESAAQGPADGEHEVACSALLHHLSGLGVRRSSIRIS